MEIVLDTKDELTQRLHELEMIAQVSTAVSSILDLDTLLQEVLVRTKRQFGLYLVNIALLDETGRYLVPVMGENDRLRPEDAENVPPIPVDAEPSIVAKVARERKVIVVNNVHADPNYLPHPLLPDTQAELTLPLVVGDELIGILDVQATELNRFTEADVRIHTTLAAQFAIAIQNAHAYQRSQRRQNELTVLNEMGRSLNSAQGIDSLLITFYEHASRLIDTTNFYVAFFEPEQKEKGEILFPFHVHDGELFWSNERRQFRKGLTEYVIKSKQPLLIKANGPEKLEELGIYVPSPSSKSWLGVPMMKGDEVIGVVAVQSYTQPYAFNEDSQRLLLSMVNQVTLAIENARLFSRLQNQAQTLEVEVVQRTAELIEANQMLLNEITEREQAEESLHIYALELERSNQELQNFAYVASHDLQEPLRKITAFGNRIQQRYADVLDERGVDYLQRMESAAKRMQQLILDLLAFSRVTTHSQPFEPVSLGDICADVGADLEFRIEETGAVIEVGALPDIEADPTQIRQLFQNLISNALKFSRPDVTPCIQVTGELVVVNGRDAVQIYVKDNGIGIEEQYQQRIFEVFERLHTRAEYEGTGVGLAICRKIVERHKGSIRVESVPNKFTTFIVILPLNQTN